MVEIGAPLPALPQSRGAAWADNDETRTETIEPQHEVLANLMLWRCMWVE